MSSRRANRVSADVDPRRGPLIYGGCALLVLFGAWLLSTSVFGLIGPSFLPSPVAVGSRFVNLLGHLYAGSSLGGHLVSSLFRWFLGVAAGVIIGVPLGVLLAWLPPVRAAVTPVFEVLRYIPPFAWIPIAVLWFGATTTAQALVVFVAAFPPCVINSQLGVSRVDPLLPNAGRMLGARPLTVLTRIVLPMAAPAAFTGVRIAISNGWMALVGAELIVGKRGLGFLIAQGQFNGQVDVILVGIIVIGLAGALIDLIVSRARVFILPWRPQERGNA